MYGPARYGIGLGPNGDAGEAMGDRLASSTKKQPTLPESFSENTDDQPNDE
jgi:hypothetical protein